MPENDIQSKGLKLRKNYYEPPTEPESERLEKESDESFSPIAARERPFFSRPDASRVRQYHIRIAVGWLVFIGLGAALIYIRFFAGLPDIAPDLLKRYGMIAVGLIYLASIFLALKDNMFDGLLAIIVPFYSLYYLFFVSGSILLRALGAALLAAFGFDCLLLLQHIALKYFDKVSYWIQHT